MLIFNIEKTKQAGEEHFFKVTAFSSSKSRQHYAHQAKVVKMVVEKFNLKEYTFLSSKSSESLSKHSSSGVYVFKIDEKPVDISKKSVTINKPKVEAETPTIEESKKEASLDSETLPYGLKSTATKTKTTVKKKRTTRKKKTEE